MLKRTCKTCSSEFEGCHPKIFECPQCRLKMQQQILSRFEVKRCYISKASNQIFALLKVEYEDDPYLPRLLLIFEPSSRKGSRVRLCYLSNARDREFVEQLEEWRPMREFCEEGKS